MSTRRNPDGSLRMTRRQLEVVRRTLAACTGCAAPLRPGPDGGHDHADGCPRAVVPEADWSALEGDDRAALPA